MRNKLPELHIFARVAEAQSFREAAEQLRISRSTVSIRISQLEKELGVTLFNRSTRRLSLTDAGQKLYGYWETISANIDEAVAAVQDADQKPTGTIRISLPTSLGAALMPAINQEFLKKWPDIRMVIDFGEQFVDVIGKGFDAVIRLAAKLPDSRLTARRLATTPRVLVASPRYLERRGTPRKLQDLKQHDCLCLGFRSEHKMSWPFDTESAPTEISLTPAFAANNDLALILAACLDRGILYIPKLLIESEIRLGRLQQIELSDAKGQEIGVFAVYPQSKPPAKVRVLVEFVDKCLQHLEFTDRWAPLHTESAPEYRESDE